MCACKVCVCACVIGCVWFQVSWLWGLVLVPTRGRTRSIPREGGPVCQIILSHSSLERQLTWKIVAFYTQECPLTRVGWGLGVLVVVAVVRGTFFGNDQRIEYMHT